MNTADNRMIRVIAFFKLVNASLLIAVGVAALRLLHEDLANTFAAWAPRLGLGPGSRFVGRVMLEAAKLTPTKVKDLAAGSFIYAGLFVTEGVGLWFLKRWAEWLTVIITASLLPVEIYEIARHPGVVKVLLLVINAALVAYLIYRIKAERAELKSHPN